MSSDLAKAIAAWRRPYEVNPAFSAEGLEGSLRDRVEALMETGVPEEEAFRQARRRRGSYGTAETEYRKVYWGKLKRRRQLLSELQWRVSMLENYLLIALRTLKKQKGYAFINIVGLAIGLSCFMLILLFVQHELSYDQFHENADQIYRVVQHRSAGVLVYAGRPSAYSAGGVVGGGASAIPALPAAGSAFVEGWRGHTLNVGDEHRMTEVIRDILYELSLAFKKTSMTNGNALPVALVGLPVEEATFFLVTNVLVVKGLILFLYPEKV